MGVEGIKVLCRIGEDSFQAAFGYGDAGELGDAINGFLEIRNGSANRRSLHGGQNRVFLEFVGKATGRKLQVSIQRINAVAAGSGVPQADDRNRPKDGLEPAGVDTATGVERRLVGLLDRQGWAYVTDAAELDVNLEEQALQFAPLGVLLGLDLV